MLTASEDGHDEVIFTYMDPAWKVQQLAGRFSMAVLCDVPGGSLSSIWNSCLRVPGALTL